MKGDDRRLDGVRKVIILARLITHLANEYGGIKGKGLGNNLTSKLYMFLTKISIRKRKRNTCTRFQLIRL